MYLIERLESSSEIKPLTNYVQGLGSSSGSKKNW